MSTRAFKKNARHWNAQNGGTWVCCYLLRLDIEAISLREKQVDEVCLGLEKKVDSEIEQWDQEKRERDTKVINSL